MVSINCNLSVKELAKLNYIKNKPLLNKLIMFIPLCVFIFIYGLVFGIVYKKDIFSIFLCCLGITLLFLICVLIYLLGPKRLEKTLLKNQPGIASGIEYTYEFNETSLHATSKYSGNVGENNLNYSSFSKAVFKNDYLFLYIDMLNVFFIPVANLSELELNEIKEYLKDKITNK